MSRELTVVERCKLENHECVIESGLKSFVDVGRALMAIRDERLYWATFDTFEEYCQGRWGFTRQRAHQLIDAAKVVDVVSTNVDMPPPENEGQARALSSVPKQKQAAVWQEAVETAPEDDHGNPKITAAHVKATAKSLNGVAGEVISQPLKDHSAANSESDALFHLKQWWKRASKKDRTAFLKWTKDVV